jgi:cytochrome b involved in lipid metabolism
MGTLKLNDFKIYQEGVNVEIEYKHNIIKRFYVEVLEGYENKDLTMGDVTMPKELVNVMIAYLRSMKRLPKNQRLPF